MNRLFSVVSVALLVGISLASVHSASADVRRPEVFRAWLSGFNEVFATGNGTLSSTGRGFFRAVIDEDAGTIEYSLTYSGITTAVQQSHLHLGATHTAGGISVFLCTNLGNGPAGTQACPQESGRITGTIATVDVIGPTLVKGSPPASSRSCSRRFGTASSTRTCIRCSIRAARSGAAAALGPRRARKHGRRRVARWLGRAFRGVRRASPLLALTVPRPCTTVPPSARVFRGCHVRSTAGLPARHSRVADLRRRVLRRRHERRDGRSRHRELRPQQGHRAQRRRDRSRVRQPAFVALLRRGRRGRRGREVALRDARRDGAEALRLVARDVRERHARADHGLAGPPRAEHLLSRHDLVR